MPKFLVWSEAVVFKEIEAEDEDAAYLAAFEGIDPWIIEGVHQDVDIEKED